MAKQKVEIPRAFRAYARFTWNWVKADIDRFQREKPEMLTEKIAYWRSVMSDRAKEKQA